MFVTKPRSTQAFEGDTVIIYCEVIGDPKPDVVWLRDFLKVRKFKLVANRSQDFVLRNISRFFLIYQVLNRFRILIN